MPHKYEDIGLPCYLCEAADRIDELGTEVVEWQEAGTSAMDRCRETHGKHFLLVGGMMGSGDGAVPAVPFHEEPVFERAISTLTDQLAAAERVVGAARAVSSLNGIVFASDDKERPMLAQTVVRHILGTALFIYDRSVGEAIPPTQEPLAPAGASKPTSSPSQDTETP